MNINYYTIGDRSVASSRLRAWKIGHELNRQGHFAWFNTDMPNFEADVVVFQKRFDLVGLMVAYLEHGIRVIFDCDDYMKPNELPIGVQITVDTPVKLELYPDAIVIPDALDVNDSAPQKSAHAEHLRKVVWIGNIENLYHIRHAAAACDKLGLELTVITDLTNKNYAYIDGVQGLQWNVNTVDEEMIKHDLFIAPYVFDGQSSKEWVNSKSANRILKSWALGLPVAATPIPSYRDAGLRHCAETVDEWVVALQSLDNLAQRQADAIKGLAFTQQFRAENVAKQWLEVFNG